MNRFLENLKSELDYQGITQKELARLCDLSVNTIHSWFTKDIFPPKRCKLKNLVLFFIFEVHFSIV